MNFSYFFAVIFIFKYVKSQLNYTTRVEFRNTISNIEFAFDLDKSSPSGIGIGGTINSVTLQNMKALSGEGMSLALYTLKPCGLGSPHSHPRGNLP